MIKLNSKLKTTTEKVINYGNSYKEVVKKINL